MSTIYFAIIVIRDWKLEVAGICQEEDIPTEINNVVKKDEVYFIHELSVMV